MSQNSLGRNVQNFDFDLKSEEFKPRLQQDQNLPQNPSYISKHKRIMPRRTLTIEGNPEMPRLSAVIYGGGFQFKERMNEDQYEKVKLTEP